VLFVALAPAIVAALVFAGTLGNGLVYDDPMALARAAESPAALAVRRFGLTYLTIHAERLVWGDWVPGFHLGNVVLHAAASGLVGVLALRLGARPWAACATGLLFAVHPVHAEAVASIENRKEILAMIFVATSVLLWLRGNAWGTVAALVAWGLAMHAKEVAAVGLAIVLPLADVLIRRLPVRRALARTLPVAAVGVLATALYGGNVLAHFTPAAVDKATSHAATSAGDALLVSAAAVPSLVRLLVFPLTLSADYPTPRPAGPLDGAVLAGVALVAIALAAFALAARRAPLAAFAIAWTLAMYLPLSNVVPLGPHFVVERYLYVPSFGACLLVALGLDTLRRRAAPAALAALALLVAGGAARSMARVPRLARPALAVGVRPARRSPRGRGASTPSSASRTRGRTGARRRSSSSAARSSAARRRPTRRATSASSCSRSARSTRRSRTSSAPSRSGRRIRSSTTTSGPRSCAAAATPRRWRSCGSPEATSCGGGWIRPSAPHSPLAGSTSATSARRSRSGSPRTLPR
jgi:hypothetical protein